MKIPKINEKIEVLKEVHVVKVTSDRKLLGIGFILTIGDQKHTRTLRNMYVHVMYVKPTRIYQQGYLNLQVIIFQLFYLHHVVGLI